MDPRHFIYLALNLFTISFPISRLADNRISFKYNSKALLAAILANMAFFIAWDVWFTRIGVWSFNPDYVMGWYIAGLPFEEWLFFITVPYACLFIYEVVKYYFRATIWRRALAQISWALILVALVTAGFNYDKWYTGVKLGSLGVALLLHLILFGYKYLGRFYVAACYTLIPFLLVNGFLTWLPVVLYNDNENLGIRISDFTFIPFFNIPVEDVAYSTLMLLVTVSVYEYLKNRKLAPNNKTIKATPR